MPVSPKCGVTGSHLSKQNGGEASIPQDNLGANVLEFRASGIFPGDCAALPLASLLYLRWLLGHDHTIATPKARTE
jgi:hypothetical protein